MFSFRPVAFSRRRRNGAKLARDLLARPGDSGQRDGGIPMFLA